MHELMFQAGAKLKEMSERNELIPCICVSGIQYKHFSYLSLEMLQSMVVFL